MCYSAMQNQAIKSKFGTVNFQARTQLNLDERMIYPLQPMAYGFRAEDGSLQVGVGQLGLVPEWVSDARGGTKFGRYCYNARSESIFDKPSFKNAILHQRAVIPVSSFFEFPDAEKPLKHRYRIFRHDQEAFWLAGLWAFNSRYKLFSCSIVTTTPMDLIANFHSRSPIILGDEQIEAWLNPSLIKPEQITSFFKPFPSPNFAVEVQAWKPSGDPSQNLDLPF